MLRKYQGLANLMISMTIQKRHEARFRADHPQLHPSLHRKALGLVAAPDFDFGMSSQYLAGTVLRVVLLALAPSLDGATTFGHPFGDTFRMGIANSPAAPMLPFSETLVPPRSVPLYNIHLRNIYVLVTVGRRNGWAMVRNLDHRRDSAMVQRWDSVNASLNWLRSVFWPVSRRCSYLALLVGRRSK